MSALMPGFWSHVAISVGRREDLLALGLGLEARLADHLAELPPGPGAVEAISTGVRFRTLDECCFRRDHVLVLRPLLSADERRDALAEAISHLGKPYDFEFDFNVTTRIVCTELVWRSLNGRGRLDFPLVKRLGRFTLTSDDIVARLLEGAAPAGAGAPPPFDVVYLAVALRTGLYEVPEPDRLAWLRAIRAGLRPTETAGPPSRVELQEAWP